MSEISETARRVAAQRLSIPRVAAPYGDPSADVRLSTDIAEGLPGEGPMRAYLAARTSFFDRVVVGCLDAGIDQVVIGAAGYDGRALRYAKPGVRWFEIDRAGTQEDKRARLAALGIACDHIRFVAADFDLDDLGDVLTKRGFASDARTLFLLEGVAAYLTPATLKSVLEQFGAVAAPGSRLAISLSVSGASPELESRRARFQASVAAMGEPVRSTVTPDAADQVLRSAGWSRRASSGRAGLVLAERTSPDPAPES